MEKGFNSDLSIRGRSYHVQTEDWGDGNPVIVTRVFINGAVAQTTKRTYSEALPFGQSPSRENIHRALQAQHSKVIEALYGEIPIKSPTPAKSN